MFRKLWLDVILGTVFIFGMMGVFSQMTSLGIFDALDPIGDAIGDMELSDLVMGQLREDPIADDRIVMVNIAKEPRPVIAMMIDSIQQYNPAVIGIDAFFYHPKEDTLGDMMLMDALARYDNIVIGNKIHYDPETDKPDSIIHSHEMFMWNAVTASVSLPTDAEDQRDIKFNRDFFPQWDVNGERVEAFSVKLASYLDSAKAEKFLARGNELELINFKGNVLDYGATKFGTKYFALDVPDVFTGNYTQDMIEGKIVIFAYLGQYLGDRENLEDKFVTPLNKRYVGRTLPDMFGGVIHANATSMVLTEDDWIDYMGSNSSIALAIILCFLNVTLFTIIYKRIPKWYDGITKLFQLAEILGLFFLQIMIFHWYNYKVDFTLAIAAIALAGDSLEVFHGVVKNTFTKEGRRSLFKADKL